MDSQVYVNNIAKKENISCQYSKKEAKRGIKRSHSSTSKSDVKEELEVKEKMRRKTPFYICEKIKKSIVLHRPIIIKPDDVARLKHSENQQKTAKNHQKSSYNSEQGSPKENSKSSSRNSEKKDRKKARNQDIVTSYSTFVGANSYFRKFSNLNHSDVTSDSQEDS